MTSNQEFFNRIVHDAQMRVAKSKLGKADVAKSKIIKFEEPTSESWINAHRRYRPANFYRYHCSHDRPLWEPCSSQTCRRDAKEAKSNLQKLILGLL